MSRVQVYGIEKGASILARCMQKRVDNGTRQERVQCKTIIPKQTQARVHNVRKLNIQAKTVVCG